MTSGLLAAALLVLLLIAGSIGTWIHAVLLESAGQWMPRSEESRSNWTTPSDITVILLTVLFMGLNIASLIHRTIHPEPRSPLKIESLIFNEVFSVGLTAVLPCLLLCSQRPLSEYGIKLSNLVGQVRDGACGFLLAFLPTVALMIATSQLRNRETQNSLLILLSDTRDPLIVALILVSAIVIAPLSEEMFFRVMLQGWLSRITDAKYAIGLTAIVFAAVHGAPDGIALLPLAAVLGYVFHRRHSYVSVVVIHALFNGTMLVLALLTHR